MAQSLRKEKELSQKYKINENKHAEDEQQTGNPINWPYFILFAYLYLLMGIVTGIIATMPYLYAHLPNVDSMALFNATSLPFSLKFILAPFLEKYTSINYGKRKTWNVIGLIFGGATFMFSGFFTSEGYCNLFAVVCIFTQIWMAILDIAAHALMVKELKSANHCSIILSYGQNVGILLGGFILLKLASTQFAESVGLPHPITTPQVLIFVFSAMLLVPNVYFHFKFDQTMLDSQRSSDRFSFCEIISYYSTFLKPSSRYFRICIFLLVYGQGLNFFNSLYDYKLVQAGFSKNVSNDIGNIVCFPVIVIAFYMDGWTKQVGGKVNSFVIIFLITIAVDTFTITVFPLVPWIVGVTGFITATLDSWRFFIVAVIINEFPVHALTGMYITVMVSCNNFGRLNSIHTVISGKFGWKLCSAIGLTLQLILVFLMPRFYKWVQEGDSHVPSQIEEVDADVRHVGSNQLELE